MSDKPAWRRTYDAVETTVTPWVEAVVHTGQFASTTALVARMRRRVGDQVNGVAARVLHLFNPRRAPTFNDCAGKSVRWIGKSGA